MGFLDGMIKSAVRGAVSDAISDGVKKAIQPKVDQYAAKAVDNATKDLETATAEMEEARKNASEASPSLTASLNQLSNALNEAGKSLEEAGFTTGNAAGNASGNTGAGYNPAWTERQKAAAAELDYQTNDYFRFIDDLSSEEEDKAVIDKWREKWPDVPVWEEGGYGFSINEEGPDYMEFRVQFLRRDHAEEAVKRYQEKVLAAGYTDADDKFHDRKWLYKMAGGDKIEVDTEHAFEIEGVSVWMYKNRK